MTEQAIAPRPGVFPMAQAPGATNIADVVDAWRARGLTPVQITEGEAVQRITITHDALTGKIDWTASKCDGVQAVSLLWSVLVDAGQEYFKAKARPQLTSGNARIALMLDGDNIQMIAEPVDDPVVLRGVLVAALLGLIEKADEPGALASVMQFRV